MMREIEVSVFYFSVVSTGYTTVLGLCEVVLCCE